MIIKRLLQSTKILKKQFVNIKIHQREPKLKRSDELSNEKNKNSMNLLTKNDKIKKIFKSFDPEVQEAIKFLINEIQVKKEIKKLEKSENEES